MFHLEKYGGAPGGLFGVDSLHSVCYVDPFPHSCGILRWDRAADEVTG